MPRLPATHRISREARETAPPQHSLPMAEHIVMRPVAALVPYARNARTHSPAQIAQIAGSIREFGFTNPVLLDGQDGIIAGHGRVLAMQQLGYAEVPCIELTHLTEMQRRAYVLADNKLAENAEWNSALLKIELSELAVGAFDLQLTGFGDLEVVSFLADMTLPSTGATGNGATGNGATGNGATGNGAEPPPARPSTAILSYSLIFENAEQQQIWFDFVRWLRARGGEATTIAGRLVEFLEASNYAATPEAEDPVEAAVQ